MQTGDQHRGAAAVDDPVTDPEVEEVDTPAGTAAEQQSPPPDRRWEAGVLGVAVLPFAVAAVALVMSGQGEYIPIADHAMIDARTGDTFGNTPLIGLYSRDDWAHPGPLLFYVLAPFYWLTGGSTIGVPLGTLAVNGAAVVGMALIARRRGGLPLMVVTVTACALLIRTLGSGFIQDPWNTYIPVLPFGLLLFLTWSLACGERWALPVAVFVASFVAQAHVGFVALGLPLLGWGAAWLVVHTVRDQAGGWPTRQVAPWRDATGPLVRPVLASAGLGVLLWLPPVLDVIANSPSNAKRVMEWFGAAEEGTQSLAAGLRVIGGQFSWPPEWLVDKQAAAVGQSPYLGDSFPVPLLLLLVGAAVYYLVRRGSTEARHLVGVLGAVLALGVLSVWRTVGPAYDYRLRWSWIPPMLAFVVVAWAGWSWAVTRWPTVARKLAVAGAALLVLVTGVNVAAAARSGHPMEEHTEVVATLAPDVIDVLEERAAAGNGDGVVLVTEPFHAAAWHARGLVLHLERQGFEVRVEPTLCLHFGEHRAYDGEPLLASLLVAADEGVAQVEGNPGLDQIAEWNAESAEQFTEVATLQARVAAGELDMQTYQDLVADIELPELGTLRYKVGVFLDERPDVEANLSVGHDLSRDQAPC